MDEVLPVCATSGGKFLCTLTSYQEVRQSLLAVGSPFKKFRWAFPGLSRPSTDTSNFMIFSLSGGPIIAGDDTWWFMFSLVPTQCMIAAFLHLTAKAKVLVIVGVLKAILAVDAYIFHIVVLYSIMYWYRDVPFQLIGAKAKFMIEVIPMITAAALHHLVVFNYGYLAIQLGFSTYIYSFAHFMRVAYDIGGKDVLIGLVMQVLAYVLNEGFYVRALALSVCLGLCIYRYTTYRAPDVPCHCKKELERLPC